MATAELETQEATGWAGMSAAEKTASVAEMPDVNLSVDGAGAPGVVKEAGAKKGQEPPKPTKTEQDGLSGSDDETPVAADADALDEGGEDEEVVGGKPKPAETDWHDDADTYDFAKRMGISDEDYDEISTREELDRTLRVIDRKAYDAEKSRLAAGQPPPAPPAPEAKLPDGQDRFSAAKAKLAEMVDESSMPFVNEILDTFAAESRELRQVLGAVQAAEQQRATDALHGKIEASIDGLNNPKRYGKPGEKLTRDQSVNRNKFRQELLLRGSAHERAGRFLEPSQLAKYADAAAFVDDNRLTIQREYDERLRKESRRIGPNAGGARHGSRGSNKKPPSNEAIREEILADPEIEQAFAKLHGR